MAAKAARRLAPFNRSILDAAEFYASHLERESGSILVSDAIEDYLSSKVPYARTSVLCGRKAGEFTTRL
jgi:hypothetical protein